MAIIMIPNIVYAVKHKNDAANYYNKKAVVICEQIGRYGCFALMIFNIPHTYFNFWFDHALTVYLSVNGGLCLAYIIFWIVCRNRNDKLKALSLSVIPSSIFLFSGITLAYVPLMAFSLLFAVTHILISYKNVVQNNNKKKPTWNEKYTNEFICLFVFVLIALTIVGIIFGADTGNGAFPLQCGQTSIVSQIK